jgi:hypothetical protein
MHFRLHSSKSRAMTCLMITFFITLGMPMRDVVGLAFTSIALGHYPSAQSIHVYLHRHSGKGLLPHCPNPIRARYVVSYQILPWWLMSSP